MAPRKYPSGFSKRKKKQRLEELTKSQIVRKLVGLAYESDGALEWRKYVEAKLGRVQVEYEIINLETKIIELKDASKKFDADIEALKFKAESYERKFQEEVDALW